MFRPMPRASGYFHTGYAQDLALLQTRSERISLFAFALVLVALPFIASPFLLDLACQVFLASIGALSLMLLTGYAGQISLGHAGLIAAGAFTTGILARTAGEQHQRQRPDRGQKYLTGEIKHER